MEKIEMFGEEKVVYHEEANGNIYQIFPKKDIRGTGTKDIFGLGNYQIQVNGKKKDTALTLDAARRMVLRMQKEDKAKLLTVNNGPREGGEDDWMGSTIRQPGD